MANRHAHKKLRAEIRARMVETGESYQRARAHIVTRKCPANTCTDLVPVTWYGLPATLATYETHGLCGAILIPSAKLWGHGYPNPFPQYSLLALMRSRGVA
jgi:hypothetical protein